MSAQVHLVLTPSLGFALRARLRRSKSAPGGLVSADDATYADREAAPAGYAVKRVGGRLHALPRPQGRHVMNASVLSAELLPPFQRGRGAPGAPIQAPPYEAVAVTRFGGAPPWAPPRRGQPGGGTAPRPADWCSPHPWGSAFGPASGGPNPRPADW